MSGCWFDKLGSVPYWSEKVQNNIDCGNMSGLVLGSCGSALDKSVADLDKSESVRDEFESVLDRFECVLGMFAHVQCFALDREDCDSSVPPVGGGVPGCASSGRSPACQMSQLRSDLRCSR